MKSYIRLLLVLAMTGVVGACGPMWARVTTDTRIVNNGSFSIELPVGWVRADGLKQAYSVTMQGENRVVDVDRVLVTRDGINLDMIDIIRFNVKDAFPHIKKEYRAGMLPSETAESYLADLKAAGIENLTVLKNAPKTVAGNQGFELHVSFKNNRGLRSERLVYGFGNKSGFYVMVYQAPSLHYYEMYKEVFRRVTDSFKLTTAKA